MSGYRETFIKIYPSALRQIYERISNSIAKKKREENSLCSFISITLKRKTVVSSICFANRFAILSVAIYTPAYSISIIIAFIV
jgi:hypothetical protein